MWVCCQLFFTYNSDYLTGVNWCLSQKIISQQLLLLPIPEEDLSFGLMLLINHYAADKPLCHVFCKPGQLLNCPLLTFALQRDLESKAYRRLLSGDLNQPEGSLGSQSSELASLFVDLGLHETSGPVCLPEVFFMSTICSFADFQRSLV